MQFKALSQQDSNKPFLMYAINFHQGEKPPKLNFTNVII